MNGRSADETVWPALMEQLVASDTVPAKALPVLVRYADGDRARVEGALRRRFFRTPGGPASRYEVEVRRLVRDRR